MVGARAVGTDRGRVSKSSRTAKKKRGKRGKRGQRRRTSSIVPSPSASNAASKGSTGSCVREEMTQGSETGASLTGHAASRKMATTSSSVASIGPVLESQTNPPNNFQIEEVSSVDCRRDGRWRMKGPVSSFVEIESAEANGKRGLSFFAFSLKDIGCKLKAPSSSLTT